MSVDKNIASAELYNTIALSVGPGTDKGPCVGVNDPNPSDRFTVHDPMIQTVGRWGSDGATVRHVHVGVQDSTDYRVFASSGAENELFNDWDWYNENTRYTGTYTSPAGWSGPRYYREGSRVYLTGLVQHIRSVLTPNSINGFFEPNGGLQGDGKIFKLPPEFRPISNQLFIQPVEWGFGTHTIAQGALVNACRVDIGTSGIVRLRTIFFNSSGNNSINYRYEVGSWRNNLDQNVYINHLSLSGMNWSLY